MFAKCSYSVFACLSPSRGALDDFEDDDVEVEVDEEEDEAVDDEDEDDEFDACESGCDD